MSTSVTHTNHLILCLGLSCTFWIMKKNWNRYHYKVYHHTTFWRHLHLLAKKRFKTSGKNRTWLPRSFTTHPERRTLQRPICCIHVGWYPHLLMGANRQITQSTHSLFHELPYFGQKIILPHGQFNKWISSHLPTKKYLGKLTSIDDLDLFRVKAVETLNPGNHNLYYNRIQSGNYSPHSFNKFKLNFPVALVIHTSLFYIIMSGALGEALKIFRSIYKMNWTLILP